MYTGISVLLSWALICHTVKAYRQHPREPLHANTSRVTIFKLLVVIAAATLAANAQTTTTTGANSIPSGISTCIVNCSAQAAPAAGCSS